MAEETSQAIWIITEETSTTTGERDSVDIGADYSIPIEKAPPDKKRSLVKADTLKQRMAEFLDVMEEVLNQAQKPVATMQLDEVELSVEINGEGQISLFGMGGKAGGKGAMTFRFKRKNSSENG